MTLSVIIVNYNVKHFLEQCLYSLQQSLQGVSAEVFVIDNNSTDGSIAFLSPLFPGINFIVNESNIGFAKACNQGLSLSTGKYILFLNPDTILAEDSITKSIAFLEANTNAGALGIHMIDGSGRFLKESKRSFPAPLTSLYKLFGLSRLFPRSKTFSQYHLGHLPENENHEVDVLAGAYMLIKKEVLQKTGGFDETFFMYGEDVDLSYRMQQAGYQNFYFAEASIIHFKGESTKKGNLNYVKMFYTAMSTFVQKHYGDRAKGFNLLIHAGIWVRGILSGVSRFIQKIGLPLIDAAIIFLSFFLLKTIWSTYIKPETVYPANLVMIALSVFTLVFLFTAYYAGLYDGRYKQKDLRKSLGIATIVVLVIYSLLPEQYRFSRGVILFGGATAFLFITLLRKLLLKLNVLQTEEDKDGYAQTLFVGTKEEYEKFVTLFTTINLHHKILGRIAVEENDKDTLAQKEDLVLLNNKIDFSEIIFCAGTLSYANILALLPQLKGKKMKIYHASSQSVVGSDSNKKSGEAFALHKELRLASPHRLREKRLLDVALAIMGIVSFPIQLFIIRKPFRFFTNCFTVLFNKKTWIGYTNESKKLPAIKKAVLTVDGSPFTAVQVTNKESISLLSYWYAHDYTVNKDIGIICRNYRKLGG